MVNLLRCGLVAASIALVWPGSSFAQGLRVSPVLLEVAAPGAATTLTLRNEGSQPITVQARVFGWSQQSGDEQLQRTSDVVVSPPAIQLAPGATQTVRVIRTARTVVRGEEAYRVVVNEVPDQSRQRAGAVAFATELRLPVFFTGQGARSPDVAWSLRQSGNATYLVAQNRGDSRLRLADLRLTGSNGAEVSRPGLVGYVLGGSSMQWPLSAGGRLGGSARLSAATNMGSIDAAVAAQ